MPAAPPILCHDTGSFAWQVMHDRHPALIDQVRRVHPYGPAQLAALGQLRAELLTGVITALPPDAHDRHAWAGWDCGYLGSSWFDVPFLWAESYFYRRLLQACDYFTPGPWQNVDPFAPLKAAELAGLNLSGQNPELEPDEPDAQALLLASVWGNRADLGFALHPGSGDPARAAGLVADDSHRIWALLNGQEPGTVTVVADNAGRELVADLLLIDHLLVSGLAAQVSLHLKPYPYYVSDAITADVVSALAALAASPVTRPAALRLREAAGQGVLIVNTHWFFAAPLSFHRMPADLAAEFGSSELTVLKGDLNYRRLVGDNLWPPTTSFDDVTGYWPGPVAALRTLKCDVITGLDDDTLCGLDATGEAWRTSGTHAVIQARL
jgi:hypothetical protein